jgi:hypothetical protein
LTNEPIGMGFIQPVGICLARGSKIARLKLEGIGEPAERSLPNFMMAFVVLGLSLKTSAEAPKEEKTYRHCMSVVMVRDFCGRGDVVKTVS